MRSAESGKETQAQPDAGAPPAGDRKPAVTPPSPVPQNSDEQSATSVVSDVAPVPPISPVATDTRAASTIVTADLRNARVDAGSEINFVKTVLNAGARDISDLIEIDMRPHLDNSVDAAVCDRLRQRVFHTPFPQFGIVVIEYPNEDLLRVVRAAALSIVQSSAAGSSIDARRVDVTFREEHPNWIAKTIAKIAAEMAMNLAKVGLLHPPTGSALYEDFVRSEDRIRHLGESFKQTNSLLIVFLEARSTLVADATPRRGNDVRICVRVETALAAIVDRSDDWVEDVKRRLRAGGKGMELGYGELKSACEIALRFSDLTQYTESLRDDANTSAKFLLKVMAEQTGERVDDVFDLTALFLASHVPGLGLSDFEKLANEIVANRPLPPPAADETRSLTAWPRWTPVRLQRLRAAGIMQLKAGPDGTRQVFCASPTIAARLRTEFEDEHFALAELRLALLSSSLFVERQLSADQVECWTGLIAAAQKDDAGTDAIAKFARTFDVKSGAMSLKQRGQRAGLALTGLWLNSRQDEDRGPAADFVHSLVRETGAEVLLQALRFCNCDASSPISVRVLKNWVHLALKAGRSIPETLTYAYVRDLLTISNVERRKEFVAQFLEWIGDEDKLDALGKALRDSIANTLLVSLVAGATNLSENPTVGMLPIFGGLPTETCSRIFACLAAEPSVRIIDSTVRKAFDATSRSSVDGSQIWLEMPPGRIVVFILAIWREWLAVGDASEHVESNAWLRAILDQLRQDRKHRLYLLQCLTELLSLFRDYREKEADRALQQNYSQLIKQFLWVRAALAG
jgi:hypothetical protein